MSTFAHSAACLTGIDSGKSSILTAICRLIELDAGRILIGGLCVASISSETIRSRITTLPQKPVFVPGTVRLNAFADDECPDAAIVEALDKVGLWTRINHNGGLNADLGHIALSHGEQQLFRLATALLQKRPLLLLDEPTSKLDDATDTFVKRLIARHFADFTIVTVAHRLDTVIDYDQIVVLEEGSVVETGSPMELLLRRDSKFKQLFDAQNRQEQPRVSCISTSADS